MVDATLALILGAKAETAARAVAMWADKPKEALDELQDLYFRSFGYWSHEDLDKGHIFRWVDNAVAITAVHASTLNGTNALASTIIITVRVTTRPPSP